MGELLMTVLLVSILWMILDLLKVFFQEHREGPGNEAVRDPGRQKLTQYAEAFEGLSETFLKLPKLKEDLEKEDREEILKETSHQVCRDCEAMEWCWSEHREDTLREAYDRLFSMEKGEEELPRLSFCIRSDRFLAELRLKYQLARQNLLWTNRLFASRRIMMDQFQEIAGIIRRAAGAIYEVDEVDTQVRRILEVQMKLHGIGVREMWKVERPDGCRELYVTMRALGKKRCVGMREAAACLSSACGERMIPARDSRMVINQDYSTVMFMPAPEYMMLCGAARVTRDGEVVSGDSFAVYHRDSGEMILSISDGMGSGPEAGQESSQTVELMEQFLNAGFDRETSIKMLHSVMLLRDSSCFFHDGSGGGEPLHRGVRASESRSGGDFFETGRLGGDRFLDEHAHGDYRGGGLRVYEKAAPARRFPCHGLRRDSGRFPGKSRGGQGPGADFERDHGQCRRDGEKYPGRGVEIPAEKGRGRYDGAGRRPVEAVNFCLRLAVLRECEYTE